MMKSGPGVYLLLSQSRFERAWGKLVFKRPRSSSFGVSTNNRSRLERTGLHTTGPCGSDGLDLPPNLNERT